MKSLFNLNLDFFQVKKKNSVSPLEFQKIKNNNWKNQLDKAFSKRAASLIFLRAAFNDLLAFAALINCVTDLAGDFTRGLHQD